MVIAMTVAIGAGLALGLWMRGARPAPGGFVDVLALPDGVVAVRAERAGPHGYTELWTRGELRWRGFVPTYAGRPGAIGVRVTPELVSVRVERGGAPANFDLSLSSGRKKTSSGALTPAQADAAFPPATGPLPVGYDPARRELRVGELRRVLPADAVAPQPYHASGGVLWIVTPGELTALALDTLAPVATIR